MEQPLGQSKNNKKKLENTLRQIKVKTKQTKMFGMQQKQY